MTHFSRGDCWSFRPSVSKTGNVWIHAVRDVTTCQLTLCSSITMKSLFGFVVLACAVVALPSQSPLTVNEVLNLDSFTDGFDLDLNSLRLVQMEGQSPVWMTELEKVTFHFVFSRGVSYLRITRSTHNPPDSRQSARHQVLRHVIVVSSNHDSCDLSCVATLVLKRAS